MATVTRTGTLAVNFSSIDTDNYSYQSITGTSNAYKSVTAGTSTYCTVNLKTGNYAETYVYFKFDTSSIPANATITSVDCKVRVYRPSAANSTRFSALYSTMCSGTTEKGDQLSINNATTTQTFTPGTWTLAELQDVGIKFYGKRTTTNSGTGYSIRIYGGTLTIEYTYEEPVTGPTVFYKQNGSWVQAEKVFYKTGGNWVEVEGMFVKDNGTWKS